MKSKTRYIICSSIPYPDQFFAVMSRFLFISLGSFPPRFILFPQIVNSVPPKMGILYQVSSKVWPILDKYKPSNDIHVGCIMRVPLQWSAEFIAFQAVATLVIFLLAVIVRRRYFSPISSIPGPFLASFSRLWHLRQIWRGDQHIALAKQHEKHGTGEPALQTIICPQAHRNLARSLRPACTQRS